MNTSKQPFLFAKPEQAPELSQPNNVVVAMGALASRLALEERTRTIHPDGRRENVAEHAFMLAKVSLALAETLYPWMDRGKIAEYAINHDDVEAYVGDTPTDVIAQHNPIDKQALEHAGLQQLVSEYESVSPAYTKVVAEYEQQQDYEAQFVRIVDKMMVLLIHIPNQGKTVREYYSIEQFMQATAASESRLLEQYPHFIELIEMKTELAHYIAQKYIVEWQK